MRKFLMFLVRKLFFWMILPGLIVFCVVRLFHIETYLIDHITRELHDRSGILLTYSDVRLGVTGTIILRHVRVRGDETRFASGADPRLSGEPAVYFTGEKLVLGIAVLPLFKQKASLHFSGSAYGGRFRGMLQTPMQSTPGPLQLTGSWSEIDMTLLAADHPSLEIHQGLSSGKADITTDFRSPFGYAGSLTLALEKTNISIPESLGSGQIDLPEFDAVTAEVDLNYSEIILRDVRFYSPDTIVCLTGVVNLAIPTADSHLNIRIRLHLISQTQPFDESMYIPITIRGQLKNPRVLFLEREL